MTIERGNEELYRLAERSLSDMITTIEQQKIVDFSTQDNIAIASFMLAVNSIDFQRKGSISNEEHGELSRLNDELESYLNELS